MIDKVISTLLVLWLGSALQLPGQPAESDPKAAAARVQANAEKGNAEAQLELGQLYASGSGVKQDDVKAAKWHRKAAEQGLARAQYQVGLDCASGEGVKINQTEASWWFRRAADQGLVVAEYELGQRCLSGLGGPKNGAEAIEWFRKAARQGYAPAEYQIGNCFFQGTGVTKNIEEGIKWIRTAAERGVAAAQNTLGDCYEKGEGVPKDFVQSYKWFALSGAQDDEHALDINIRLAKLEANLTKEQIAEAQRLARDFKPAEESDRAASVSPGSTSKPASSDNSAQQTNIAVTTPIVSGSAPTGFVTVKAEDERCEVFVDGAFVGNSPAKLKLTEGLHVFEVKKSGFKDYRRELKIVAGSDLTLTAALGRQ
jgi:TPR repeat protein